MQLTILFVALSSVLLTALAQIALRKTMLDAAPMPTGWSDATTFVASVGLNPWFLAGIVCYGISICLWLVVLARTEVSLAYPVSAFGFVVTAMIGYFYLGENVNLMRLSGIGFICLGIIIVSRSV